MQYTPTRVRAKFDGFHISAHGYAQNPPDFRPKPSAQDISGRMLLRPTRVRAKFGGFHIPAHDMARNPPDFRPKPSARGFSGRMQYAPTRVRAKFVQFHISAHGYTKNPPDFRPKPSARGFSGRMQYAPTRVHEKPARFHISAPGYVKNAPDFTLPDKDTPKTRPVLGANLWRGTFGGVCFCAPTRVRAKFDGFHIPAHGCAENLPDFRPKPLARNIWGRMLLRPYTGAPKTRRVPHFPIRIHQKRTRFYPSQ